MKTETFTARGSFGGAEMLLPIGRQAGDEFDIQWMPPGEQEITCQVKEEPREMQFVVGAEHAQAFNGMLQFLRRRAAAGGGDEPFIDFNHEDGAAAGHPVEMYWAGEDVKKGGIRLRGKWTGSGKAAVAGKDFTRFSPEWDFDPETDEPIGIGVNLGGLVNRAAFRTMAALGKNANKQQTASKERIDDMTREEFQQMLTEGLKPITTEIEALKAQAKGATTAAAAGSTAQAAQGGGIDEAKIVKLIQEGNKALVEKMTAFETRDKDAATARAKGAVQAHVGRGAIAPEDTEVIGFYTDAYLVSAEKTEKAMAKLPGKRFVSITSANGGTVTATNGEPEHVFIAKAKEFGKANNITDEALALTAYGRTSEGKGLYEQFRQKIVPGRK